MPQADDDVDRDPGDDQDRVRDEHRPHRANVDAGADGYRTRYPERPYTIAIAITAKKTSAVAAAATLALAAAAWLVSSLAMCRVYAAERSASTSSSFDMSARPLMSSSFARS